MKIESNNLYLGDCMELFKHLKDKSVDCVLTDIPYDGVNRKDNGLRDLNRKDADVLTFNVQDFVKECYRVAKSTIIIFCGHGQISEIYNWFDEIRKTKKGTVRQLVWEKTNPSPMNGQYVYLSGIENAVWFRKPNGTFNAHCKNTVFRHPLGSAKLHPTEKNHKLLNELILDNTNEGDLILDPCMGSGAHCLCAKELGRNYIGFELNEEYFNTAKERF